MSSYPPKCGRCHSNRQVIKKEKRFVKSRKAWRRYYYCKKCKHKFVYNDGYKRLRHPKKIVDEAVSQRQKGLSLGKIKEHIKQLFGTLVSKKAILEWANKFSVLLQLFEAFVSRSIEFKGSIHSDEVHVKVRCKGYWSWNARDRKTKYVVGGPLTRGKPYEGAKRLFRRLKHCFGNRPKRFFSDKLQHYRKAFNKYFYRTAMLTHGIPIACKKHGLKYNNNAIERWNQYSKELCKLSRGFKNPRNAFNLLELNRLCFNFLHSLESLHGVTPAFSAGVRMDFGRRAFRGLIEVAAHCVLA